MDPVIENYVQEDNCLKFTLQQADVSIANGLRRIIISEIPCLVFRTSPHSNNQLSIHVNTSRMNNEIIKQRISCIPIHIDDLETFDVDDYIVEADLKNDEESVKYLTTGDFKVKYNDKELTRDAVVKMFPPDPITGDFIDIVRLRPGIKNAKDGEHVKLSMKMSIATAKQDSSFNVASTCSYRGTPDETKIQETWTKKSEELKTNNIDGEEIEKMETDWRLLDAKRIVIPNSFDFVIESVGQFTEKDIVSKAARVMIGKIDKLNVDVSEKKDDIIRVSESTIPNSYDLTLLGEDYTLGKVIEFVLFTKHFKKTLNYCGFRKPHPHIEQSVIRIGFIAKTDLEGVITLLKNTCDDARTIYTNLLEQIRQL